VLCCPYGIHTTTVYVWYTDLTHSPGQLAAVFSAARPLLYYIPNTLYYIIVCVPSRAGRRLKTDERCGGGKSVPECSFCSFLMYVMWKYIFFAWVVCWRMVLPSFCSSLFVFSHVAAHGFTAVCFEEICLAWLLDWGGHEKKCASSAELAA